MPTAQIEEIPQEGWAQINNSGQIVVAVSASGSATSQIYIDNVGSVAEFTIATHVGSAVENNSGEVAFTGYKALGTPQVIESSYVIQNGKITQLPYYQTVATHITGITDTGEVTGFFEADSTTVLNSSNQVILGGFTYQNGTITPSRNFVTVGPASYAIQVLAANGDGDVVGIVGAPGYDPSLLHSFLVKAGQVTDLGSSAGLNVTAVFANALNNEDVIVGEEQTFGNNSATIPFLWRNGTIHVLPTASAVTSAGITAINNLGVAVGVQADLTGKSEALAWVNGAVINLNDLLPANSGWVLSSADDINDSNQIVGAGTYNGVAATFELTLPTIAVSAATALSQYQAGLALTAATVVDTAADISAAIDGLQTLAALRLLGSIALSDSVIPTLSLTTAQATADSAALAALSGNFSVSQTASGSGQTISGVANALGNEVLFSGDASQYSIAPAGDGVHFTVATAGGSDRLSDIQALQFADVTEIVVPAPATDGVVTGGTIAALYGAVFGRMPDLAGLSYYEKALAANPSLSLLNLAEYFLSAPEYTGNPNHTYAQNAAGEAQFITDCYANLLNRAPETGAIAYYQNLISFFTRGLTPGTSAFAAADFLAHATLIVDFSTATEFLSDVQVTAANPASAGYHGHWLVLI